ncbi:MAG: fumarate hydratase [Saccharofermentanales bacterium]
MREIRGSEITELVQRLCVEANVYITEDISCAIERALQDEASPEGRAVLEDLSANIRIAREEKVAACQDTGMAVIFMQIGQDVHITGSSLWDAVSEGVSSGYTRGYLRASVVEDPFLRRNTGDNTPPVLHTEIVPGDEIFITVAPKGFGSENMSALRMLKPSDGVEGVKAFVLDTVLRAGANPCPPIILGIGIGGTMEKAALLAKKALLRDIGTANPLAHISVLEKELLESINRTGIGPGGLGGRYTALAVNVDVYPTHIAGLPVAVNVSCHATRHASGRI